MATYNAAEHTTTFVATPVQMDQNCSVSPFATAASHFITTSTPSSVMLSGTAANHRQTTAAVTSSSTSSSYTFLQIKREPCQVSEVTTSNHCHQHHQQQQQQQHHHGVCSATSSTSLSATAGNKTVSASTLTTLVKIEPPSPKVPDLLDKSSSFGGNTNNSVPIGIAVARKRPQESSAPSMASCNSAALSLPQTLSKDLNCFGIRVADLGGVGTGCGNIFFTGNGDLMTGSAATTAEELALQSVNRAPSTIWQYPSAALPFESVISMSPATVGLQYSREASRAAGQVVLLPAATAAALGISNIPPLCYTPTDPFQQAAAAAALVWPSYLSQGTATAAPTATTLQPPHNFIFPTMNSAHTAAAAAAATLQPQSYAAAASLQLFGSSYLRNATEFMAAAGKTTTTMQQNHLISAASANGTTTGLTMPTTPMGSATTALSFETRDKKTMTTTTTTNLIELQGNTQAALNLIRLPTPPTSATIGDGQNTTGQLQATPQILFQTAASPAPTLLNLSMNGTNAGATATLARTPIPSVAAAATNNFLNNNTTIGPPTPVGDDHNATTPVPLALNFKTATATTCTTDALNGNATSIVVGVPRGLASVPPPLTTTTMQPQMQDVNIQTDTPVCSEDENSSCPLTSLQQQQHAHSTQILSMTAVATGECCLTPPTYNCAMNNDDDCAEPLELTKSKSNTKSNTCNEIDAAGQHQIAKENIMCHNGKNESNHLANIDGSNGDIGNRVGGKPTNEPSENNQIYEIQQEQQLQNDYTQTITSDPCNESTSTTTTAADDFAGLELLSNISASSLPNKSALNLMNIQKQSILLRVKQEPQDVVDELPRQEAIIMPTIAAKIEQNISTGTTAMNGTYESPVNQCNSLPIETPSVNGLEPPSVAEPLGGLNLLCALAEQRIHEEEEEQGGNFFTTNSENQRVTTPLASNLGPFIQQSQLPQHQSPFRLDQSNFPSMDGIELPIASNAEIPVASSSPIVHVKRKKHKHSKSSKSSKCSSTAFTVTANGGTLTTSMLCSGKISKRANKKHKKKYSKEKKRQQRAEAAAAAAAAASNDLDFDDEQLQEELQKAFISGTSNGNRTVNSNVKWPSAEEIFNIMESRMRQRLADITRQYRKKKRKLDEISKTQHKRKKCSKLFAQQLLQHQQQQQQQTSLLSSPLSAAASLSLNGSTTTAPPTPTLGDYKFSTTKFTSPASAAGPNSSSATASPYLQPSSFPLRFPPISASTADEDSDKNSHSRTKKRNNHIYKPVRLEPSSLSAAIIANGASNSNSSNCNNNSHNNNNNGNNNNGSSNNNSNTNSNTTNTNTNTNTNGSTNGVDASSYSLNTTFRLAQKHASSEPPALTLSKKERKIMSKEKAKHISLDGEKASNVKIKKSKSKSKSAKDTPASNAPSITAEEILPRSATDHKLTLTNEHLYRKETRVLTDMGGLFYAGVMKPLQPPDIYAITLDGERGNKPHIMSREEIFKDTILEIAPNCVNSVPVGTRLCAYWSQQYRCLYPGRAIESESSEGEEGSTKKDFVSVEFDDGDSGRIRLQNIRLLMSDYPIVEYNDNPLYSLGKQKKSAFKSGANSTIVDSNAAVQLFDAKLGHPSMLPLGISGNDTEMYARRTEKKRLKKNPKKKLIASIIPSNSVPNNPAGSSTNLPPATAENTEHNRKHHKHKKHKKHKKHHRKAEEAAAKRLLITSHKNSDAKDSTGSEHLKRLKVQDSEQNQEHTENTDTTKTVPLKPIKLEKNTAMGGVRVKNERLEEIEEESASNMMSENSDEVKGDDDDEIEHNNSKGSKIAAFLPERQLWGWLGSAYRKAGVKGRARKQFYKTIKRGKELITVGDCAVFLSTGRPDRPYIGRIESMWETASSNKVVRVRWFYHPEETTGCPNLKYPGALFESPHEDENDVQTISHRCEVLQFERYFEKFGADAKQYQSIYDNNDTYYLAGYYNPRVQTLTLQEKIPTTTAAITFDSNSTSGAKVNKGIEKKQISTIEGTTNP